MADLSVNRERIIKISSAARISPPSILSDENWSIESLVGPKRWTVSVPAVMLLLACIESRPRRDVVDQVAQLSASRPEDIDSLLVQLERNGLIVDRSDGESSDTQESLYAEVARNWAATNWAEAAEYHLSTLDYPFPDYATNGRQIDSERMRGYLQREPDDNRYKVIADPVGRVDLPTPDGALCDIPLATAWQDYVEPTYPRTTSEIDQNSLFEVLSLTFAEVGVITGGRWERAPMMRRTSPSGGARHPSEAYLLVIDMPKLKPGWYHIGASPSQLSLLREVAYSDAELREIFPLGYGRAPFDVKCLVALTTLFERNMYRYREPRTFRTVHMDVGHLATTLGLAAAAYKVMTHVAYADDDEAVERAIGLSGLEEGYMLTVSMGIPFDGA